MNTRLGPVISLVLLSLPSLTSAAPDRLELGDRVRLQLPTFRKWGLEGTISSMSDSQLTLQTQGAKDVTETLAWSGVSRVYRSEGTRSHALAGALIGFLTGIAIGAATAPSEPTSVFEMDPEIAKAALLMGGGLLVGAGVGASIRTERWRRISDDPHLELAHRR